MLRNSECRGRDQAKPCLRHCRRESTDGDEQRGLKYLHDDAIECAATVDNLPGWTSLPPSLSPAQSQLLERFVDAIRASDGIAAIWLSGSLAAGEGDEFSDVDVHVAADEPGATDWTAVARSVGAVFARPRMSPAGGLVNAATSDGVRFDMVVHRSADLEGGLQGPVAALHDPEGLLGRLPRKEGRRSPEPQQVLDWVEEFLRSLLLLRVVGPREEWLRAEVGSLWMLDLLMNVMLAENGESGAGSALRLNQRLTEEQIAVLRRLPPLTPSLQSVVTFQVALAADFLPRARRVCSRLGAQYPDEFEAAVRRRLGSMLDPTQTAAVAPPMRRPPPSAAPRYDGIADWYEELFAGYGDLSDAQSSSSCLARLLGPGQGLCLDVACGGGLHHEAIASSGRRTIGVDLSADQLRVAGRRSFAVLARASALALPFPDGTFPTVTCTYLHTDIDDMAPVLKEIRRVLKSRGWFVYLGVHPCFWGHFIENPLGPGRVIHPGYLETGWIDSPYWRDSAGLRAKVGARHVTISELLNAFLGAGLKLELVDEPSSRTGHADRIGIVASRPDPG